MDCANDVSNIRKLPQPPAHKIVFTMHYPLHTIRF